MTLNLYLAHPFDERNRIRRWEKKFEASTGINLINPFFDKPSEGEHFKSHDKSGKSLYDKLDGDVIVKHDIKLIKDPETYGVLAYINGATSYGTIQEMVYAHNAGKEVFSVITNGHDSRFWKNAGTIGVVLWKLQYQGSKVSDT